jgi:hypothetical protein
VKLIRHVDVVVEIGVAWFGGLTGFVATGKKEKQEKQGQQQVSFGDDNKKNKGRGRGSLRRASGEEIVYEVLVGGRPGD